MTSNASITYRIFSALYFIFIAMIFALNIFLHSITLIYIKLGPLVTNAFVLIVLEIVLLVSYFLVTL